MLVIAGQLGPAGVKSLDDAKLNGTISQALVDATNARPLKDAEAAAKAIAAKLTGATATDNLTYLPAGALDPCGFDASKLNDGDIKVTSTPSLSDLSPMSECVYTFTGTKPGEGGTGRLALYTLTSAQAAAAQPATTPAAAYSTTIKGYGSQGSAPGGGAAYGTASSGPISMAGRTSGEPDFALLAGPANANASTHGLMLRVADFRSSYVIDKFHCADEIARLMGELVAEAEHAHGDVTLSELLGPAGADAAVHKVADDIEDWCTKQAQLNERAPSGLGG